MALTTEQVLEITLREMKAFGMGWRMNWSEFDGRYLRAQLNTLAEWAERAARGENVGDDYSEGSNFLEDQRG